MCNYWYSVCLNGLLNARHRLIEASSHHCWGDSKWAVFLWQWMAVGIGSHINKCKITGCNNGNLHKNLVHLWHEQIVDCWTIDWTKQIIMVLSGWPVLNIFCFPKLLSCFSKNLTSFSLSFIWKYQLVYASNMNEMLMAESYFLTTRLNLHQIQYQPHWSWNIAHLEEPFKLKFKENKITTIWIDSYCSVEMQGELSKKAHKNCNKTIF